jgi:dienelactone hydrolase
VNLVPTLRKLVVLPLIALSGLGVVVAESAASAAQHVPTGDAFYAPPRPLAKAKPGTIIRSAPIADAPAGARAWKILYHSRAVDGKDIAVSGWVIAPTSRAPRGGRVVVTWAHGTSGLADVCAPSKQADIASGAASTSGTAGYGAWMPMVQTLIDAGYVIAATDYEGIGTPGLHPFLVGESEGRSVLDAARAAHGLKAAATSSRALVFGQSQGGHAALFAGELAASYAPELRVLGVAAGAPGPDVEHTLPFVTSATFANGFVVSVVEGFHAAYPRFDPAAVLTPAAIAQASIVDQQCLGDVATAYSTSPLVLAHNPLDIPALATIVRANSYGNRPTGAPLLVVQGTADQGVPQFLTDAFVKRACTAGDTVDYRVVPGATHGEEIPAVANDVAAWFADRVNGTAAPSTCSEP